MPAPPKRSYKKYPPQFQLRLKLSIGEDTIGPGKVDLLRKIDALGSISAAARDMGINYRRAWFLLETMNTALGQPTALTSKGGAAGGGASLTDAGRAVITAYENCLAETEKNTRETLDTFQKSLNVLNN